MLILVFGTVYLQGLGRFSLMEPDEGRYAEIPREMLELSDFITPHLNYVNYFEKPPLLYWLNALSMKLFGINEWAARFPSALSGLCTILFVYYLGRQLFGRRQGMLASLVLGSCTGFMVQSRIITTDVLLTFCLTVALGCFIMAVTSTTRRSIHLILFYVFIGLSILTKGLIGLVFPIAIASLFICSTRHWHILKEMHLPAGVGIILLVSAPWFLLVSQRYPEFLHFFFVHEHFERFLSTVHRRYQPFWFFIPILLAGMLPWSIMIPVAVQHAWRQRTGSVGEARLYLLLWLAFILVFFSVSKSKLIPYILPIYPAAALLLGEMLAVYYEEMKTGIRLALYSMGVVMMLTGIIVFLAPGYVPDQVLTIPAGIFIGLLLFMQGAIAYWCAIRRDFALFFSGVLITALLIMTVGLPMVVEKIAVIRSLKPLGEQIRQLASPDAIIVSQGLRQGLSFYARRRIVILENPGEAAFGFKHGRHENWLISRSRFHELWDSEKPVFAVVRHNDIELIAKTAKTKHRLLLDNGKFKLITNTQ